jgi:glycosyltransferase involved in cell wall biosynthesis
MTVSNRLAEKIKSSDVVFVADLFAEDYVGGAELTTEALIESSPFKVTKIRCKELSLELLEAGHEKYWVFGNWASIDYGLIPTIAVNMKYSVLEYDYKFCKYRSPDKHRVAENTDCNCQDDVSGKAASSFYLGARYIWWMSEKQQSEYLSRFPFLADRPQSVLSSVFSEDFWVQLKALREANSGVERQGWLVLGSNSWIKGSDDAINWCRENEKTFKVLNALSPAEVLDEMSKAEGFVYLPKGGDTCPRMVIEAKLLGCKLHLNENVQHKDELWFTSEDPLDTESYLYAARQTFWNSTAVSMKWVPTVSGYTTIHNPTEMGYPWKECISSMLGFCDEVVVLDAGSTDGSWEELNEWASKEPKLKPSLHKVDFSHPRFAYDSDGLQKARSRALCTKEFCWQMDADEILPESDWSKVKTLAAKMHPAVDLISLPVIEYWGSKKKVRMDVNPWKWRLSRNKSHITHGIPGPLRLTDDEGNVVAMPGTDGCDYIDSRNYDLIPHASFYTQDAHNARLAALSGNPNAFIAYNQWMQAVIEELPAIRHFSWLDIGKKIRNYRKYWSKFWQSLYNIEQKDTPENNMFFDKSWSDVTESEIDELSSRLASEMGGWVFHNKIDWNANVPYLELKE